jgi:hypothetical protein
MWILKRSPRIPEAVEVDQFNTKYARYRCPSPGYAGVAKGELAKLQRAGLR